MFDLEELDGGKGALWISRLLGFWFGDDIPCHGVDDFAA